MYGGRDLDERYRVAVSRKSPSVERARDPNVIEHAARTKRDPRRIVPYVEPQESGIATRETRRREPCRRERDATGGSYERGSLFRGAARRRTYEYDRARTTAT